MIFVVATLICYATHVLVAKGWVRMPASKLKPWCRLIYAPRLARHPRRPKA